MWIIDDNNNTFTFNMVTWGYDGHKNVGYFLEFTLMDGEKHRINYGDEFDERYALKVLQEAIRKDVKIIDLSRWRIVKENAANNIYIRTLELVKNTCLEE